ncbi:MAG TPA: 30S ribosomal protein S4 [Anaerohalosphaeraceae bacterium]|nr:30S ribosomal protein S4 [Anaerohalosphaeraceae bacterium]
MGRYLQPSCRLCRREGMKLLLKGTRCETAKCAIEKRQKSMAPGQHGWRKGRGSDYAVRLREKQKLKRYYGLLNTQFMKIFDLALKGKGDTGKRLLEMLERRLDNVVYKLNFAPSRKAARILISHGHIYLNGRRVDIPSIMVKVGDKITLKNAEKTRKLVKAQLESNPNYTVQGWLQFDVAKPMATVVALPTRDDVQLAVEEQLVVEFCSR